MNRCILTGATGTIGMALVEELIEQGKEILVIANPNSKRNDRLPKNKLITVKYCDLENYDELENDTGVSYDIFYHLAWKGTTGEARNDMLLQNENVKYALKAVRLAKRFGCKSFIGAGSQAEYGRYEGLLCPNTPAFPENGYGMAKLCAGQMTRELAHELGMEQIWVRVLSVFGPNDGEQSMVISSIKKLLAGSEAGFTPGEQQWDFLYSKDAGRAFYLIGCKGKDGRTYVLGSGETKRLKEYIKIIGECTKAQDLLRIGEIPYSDKQVMYLCADISMLQEDTGFTPEVAFRTGIEETIRWIKNN